MGWVSKRSLRALVLVPVATGFASIGVELSAGVTATTGPVLLAVRVGLLGLFGSCAVGVVLYYTETDAVPGEEFDRLVGWTVAASVLWTAVTGVVLVATGTLLPRGTRDWFWSLSLGLLLGACVGLVTGGREARAVVRTRRIERERVEAERDRLQFLYHLLRHNFLNGLNVVRGHATILQDRLIDPPSELGTIKVRADALVDHLEDVRALVRATVEETDPEPVNASRVLDREVARMRRQFEDAEFETTVPSGVHVRADPFLATVFSNVLRNAVEHNDADTPRVGVAARTTGERAVVTLADNGPGIPEERKRTLDEFDPDDPTLGLYLAATLVSRYDGTITVTDNPPRGTVVTVELPLADSEPPTSSSDSADPASSGGGGRRRAQASPSYGEEA